MTAGADASRGDAETAALRVKERVLHWQRAGSRRVLKVDNLNDAAWDVAVGWESDSLLLSVETYMLTDHLADSRYTDTKSVPATWRDGRRLERLSSKWRLVRWRARRRPVTWRTIRFEVEVGRYLAYPEAQIPLPQLGSGRRLEPVVMDWLDYAWENRAGVAPPDAADTQVSSRGGGDVPKEMS